MTIFKHVIIAIFGAGFTVAMYVVYAIAWDQLHAEKSPITAISEMLGEAKAGHVEEVKIHGTRYEYRVRGVTKVAYGPKTTQDEAAKLIAAPRVVVE